MKKIVLLILIPLILIGCVKKEMLYEVKGQINGIVVDESEKPIIGAKVTLGNVSAVTDSKGYFLISDLQVGGNPKYQLYIEKEGYTPKVQEVTFETSVNVEGTDDNDDSIPLNNSTASVKVSLSTLVDLTGKLAIPSSYGISPSDKITISANLTVDSGYSESLSLSKIDGTVDSDMNITLKNMPRYGLYKNSSGTYVKIINKLTINVYVNGSSISKFNVSLSDLDLTKYAVENISGRHVVDLGSLTPSKSYMISGYVYPSADELKKDVSLRQTLKNAIVVLKLDDKEIKRTTTDSTGKYTFNEITADENYQLCLLSFDSNDDGKDDYSGRSDFEKFTIEQNQTGDETINLWYQSSGAYSIDGTLYAGNKEDIPVANATIGLFSSSGLIDEVKADSNGQFQFTNVTTKDVYMISYDYDSDSNGYINFIGYKSSDATSLKTKVSLSNTNLSNVTGVELYAKVNSDEPNYVLKLKGSNFFSVNSAGTVYNQMSLAPGDNIILTFDKLLSQTTLDSMATRKVKVVTITDIGSGSTIDTVVTLDGSDNKKLIVAPKSVLSAGTYRIQVTTELNTATAYNLGVRNTINTQLLNSLTLTIE
ncbi:MAG: carboxypeptidase regulatory-like domain-containing protein [Fusobacteriaceae bacterium]|nr:carboxypeptidase regulatory-like domain-containing protein [Fusobacteriaceae bacterium]